MRIGILGGSFDPPHVGHLWIAEAVRESLKLDEIRWIPAAISPLKPDGPVASNQQRRQMLGLAIAGCESYRLDDRELKRGDVSYTLHTLQELKKELPDAEFFLIMGSDSLASIRHWHQPQRLPMIVQVVGLLAPLPVQVSKWWVERRQDRIGKALRMWLIVQLRMAP